MSHDYAERLLSAALAYAEQGISVFPVRLYVRGEGKKGVSPIKDWDENSTTDAGTIRSWFTGTWAATAIGIDTGKSGLVVADGDVSDGKHGPEEWAALQPPVTARVRTPSGGLHDVYREDPQHPVSVDNTGAVADGVDVRGRGGFIIAAPSIDPRGGGWAWESGEAPDFATLPVVPRVITERVEAAHTNKRPKASTPSAPKAPRPEVDDAFSIFGTVSTAFDHGPAAGYKSRAAAAALLDAEYHSFVALTEVGSGRSHILAQRFGVLAGHGVGVFWTYEKAMEIILKACADNGFTAEHGEAYAEEQAARGLEYGMRELWVPREPTSPIEALEAQKPALDEVEALMAEMLTLSEVAERPAPRYLIKGLLNLDSESWIIGEPGCKKSFVALDMCMHVARGQQWQGFKVTQADVIIIAAEGAGGMSKRVRAWRETYHDLPPNVRVLPRPIQVNDAARWAVLVQACKRILEGRPGLIVIDTQARVTVGLVENDATDMGYYVAAVNALKQATAACVLTIHHTGRKGGDARGSSAIDGAQDTELKVLKSKTEPLCGELVTEKQKDLDEHEAVPLRFGVVPMGVDEDGDTITSLVLLGAGDALDAANGAQPEIDHGRVVRISEPQAWTKTLVDHSMKHVQRQILQVIKETCGQQQGRSEVQIRNIVVERWYSKYGTRNEKGVLSVSTWAKAWTEVLALSFGQEGEAVIVQPGTAKTYILNPATPSA
jgi:hypothetical protein